MLTIMGVWLAAAAAEARPVADLAVVWLGPAALAPLLPSIGFRVSRLRWAWTVLCIPALAGSVTVVFPTLIDTPEVEAALRHSYSAGTGAVSIATWLYRAARSGSYRRGASWAEALALGIPIGATFWFLLTEGPRVPIELSVPIATLALGRLLAAQRSRWTHVQSSLVDALGDGVLVVDGTGLVLAATKSARELFSDFSIPDDGGTWSPPQQMRRVLADATDEESTFNLVLATGVSRHFEVRTSPMWQRGYPPGTRVATVRETTDERAMEERLGRLAYFDSLTGLSNRRRFVELLSEHLSQARHAGRQLALLYLDLDRLKEINDGQGHAAGDELLREIAKRFRQRTVRASRLAGAPEMIIGRLGGDEFAVMVDPVEGIDDAIDAANQFLEVAREPVIVEASALQSSASIGIALFPEHAEDLDTLIHCADTALYSAKDHGRDRYAVFDQDLAASVARRSQMGRELREAIENGALEIYFQPKIDLETGDTIGAEALLRWNNKTLGSVSPAEFVPLAESSHSIIPLGKWVIAHTFRTMKGWRDQGRKLVPIAINVSGIQLADGGLVDFLSRAMQRFEIPPELIELELTETSYLEEDENTDRTLAELRAIGIKTALDDFGTGYSSLAYLTRIPLDVLKIDRSLVKNLVSDPDAVQVLKAVTSLAHGLGLTLVAEGIEDPEQVPILLDVDCKIGQGFLYSPAIPPEAFAETLERVAVAAAPVSENADADLPRMAGAGGTRRAAPRPAAAPAQAPAKPAAQKAAESYVMIVDDEVSAPLGEVAIELTRKGILVLYTRFPDEAVLLAKQDPGAIGTLMIAPTAPSPAVRSALDCVRGSGRNPQVVVVGAAPDDKRRAELRNLGAQWAAWEPYSKDELINLITMSLGAPSTGDRRKEPRLPVSIDGSLTTGEGESELIRVCSLSEGGAFVATQRTLPSDTRVTLSFRLDGDAIELPARVVYDVARRSSWQRSYPRGMGLQFAALDPDVSERLALWAKQRLARFTV